MDKMDKLTPNNYICMYCQARHNLSATCMVRREVATLLDDNVHKIIVQNEMAICTAFKLASSAVLSSLLVLLELYGNASSLYKALHNCSKRSNL
jgi:hypothetical protein